MECGGAVGDMCGVSVCVYMGGFGGAHGDMWSVCVHVRACVRVLACRDREKAGSRAVPGVPPWNQLDGGAIPAQGNTASLG